MHLRIALGVRIKRGVGSNTVLKLFLNTKQAKTNKCDALESNNMVARVEFTRNSPYTTSGGAYTFSAFLPGSPEFYGVERPVPEAAISLLAID